MISSIAIAAALLATGASAPPEAPATRQPADYVAPPWETNPEAFLALAGELEFFSRFVPGHAQRWQQYRLLEMTPVEDGAGFFDALEAAIRGAAEHLPELPKDENGEVISPIAAAPAEAPEGPMTDELFEKLAVALHEQLLFMQDRSFEFQKERWLAGRKFSTMFPDNIYDATKDVREVTREVFDEEIDAAALAEGGQWELIERFYEHRRTAVHGGYNVTGAALATPLGMRVGVFETSNPSDALRLSYRVEDLNYWQGDLIACGLRITWPQTPPSAIIQRDRKILRADILLVAETKNRDRAPLTIHAYFDPKEGDGGKWQVESCCFTSSPFAASVAWVR